MTLNRRTFASLSVLGVAACSPSMAQAMDHHQVTAEKEHQYDKPTPDDGDQCRTTAPTASAKPAMSRSR